MSYKVKATLPFFTGFYKIDDIFSVYSEIDYFEGEYPELYNELSAANKVSRFVDEIDQNINYISSYDNVCRMLVKEVYGKIFGDYVECIEFDRLYMPNDYRFTSDEIQVTLSLDSEQLSDIKKLIFIDNRDKFDKFLNITHGSRDGLISFIINNAIGFIAEYDRKEDDFLCGYSNMAEFDVMLEFLFILEREKVNRLSEFDVTHDSDSIDSVSPFELESLNECIEYFEPMSLEDYYKQAMMS